MITRNKSVNDGLIKTYKQELMSRQIIDPTTESATTILLNVHNIKMNPSDNSLYS